MKLLKEMWLTKDSSDGLLTCILDVQDRLRKMTWPKKGLKQYIDHLNANDQLMAFYKVAGMRLVS